MPQPSRLNRRHFIRNVACLSAAPILADKLLGQSTPPTSDASRASNASATVASHTPLPSKPTPRNGGPRLFYTASTAQAAAAASPSRWSDFLAAAEKLRAEPLVSESEALGGVGQHGNIFLASRHCGNVGFALGLAYHATGDARFAERIRETLLHYATYREWIGPGFASRKPRWHSELATAAITFGFATGYDAIAERLSADERRRIREALIDRGIRPLLEDWVLPETRIHALDSMGHNWWSVCVSSAGVGLLAIAEEEPRAAEWLRRTREALAQWFRYSGNVLQNKPATFDPAGGLYESVGYTEYALAEYLRFRTAHQNVFGGAVPCDDLPWLEHAIDFAAHTLYPRSEGALSVNFGDSDARTNFLEETLRLLLASGFQSPLIPWYLTRIEKPGAHGGANVKEVFRLLHPTPRAVSTPQPVSSLPTSACFSGIGWAMLRSSWQDDATLLAVKSGYTWNHAHADAASFMLFHRGQPLLIDSGKCSYDRPEYMQYYVRSRAHNVVLFDGEGQPAEDNVRGEKFPGSLHSLLEGFGLRYLFADATGPMAHVFSRNYRHWLWIGRVILVIDDIRAHHAGRFDWLLHYAGEVQNEKGGEGETSAARGDKNTVRIANGAAAARVQFLHPASLQRATDQGLADGKPDVAEPYLRLSTVEPSREAKFIAAILLEEPDQPNPRVEVVEGGADVLGVRIRQADTETEIYFNILADGRTVHLNSVNRLGPWTTDAYLLATTTTRSGASSANSAARIDSVLMIDGSMLRRGDEVVWDSYAKANVVFSPGKRENAKAG